MSTIENAPTKPTIKDLKSFASVFEKEDWAFLCRNQEFLNSVLDDIDVSHKLAERILSKKVTKVKQNENILSSSLSKA